MSIGVIVLAAAASLVAAPQPASALSGSDFNAGYIISDQKFADTSTMSEASIQSFLEAKVPYCRDGYTCLKDYRQDTFSRAAVEPGHCSAYVGAPAERASRIIYKTAQACKINPQVLLVLLQKETSLVTDTWPTAGTYRKATGYGCPDTSSCDAAYYGFYNQVYQAAWQFRQYNNYPARQYRIGNVSIGYNPNSACGSSVVNIRNQATANLYNYTPYQPNAAALANLRGIGNTCSAYGNRNFWVFFNDWFGSPTGAVSASPFGNLEVVAAAPGTFRVAGWALDPETSASIDVHIYVGTVGKPITASLPRADVGGAYPANGAAHGFDVSVPVSSEGANQVCAYAINVGAGDNVLLGCRSVTAMVGAPVGVLDTAGGVTGGVTVSGWALDPDTKNPIAAHVYVDSVGKALVADTPVASVGTTYPAYGSAHGYQATLPATPGQHNVCAYGINTGFGSNVQLGCKTVTVPTAPITEKGRPPIGALESVDVTSDGLAVTGWTIDPDTTASIAVHIYVDATGVAYTANVNRPDIQSKYPAYGAAHGYAQKISARPGAHKVCAYGINTGPGGHTLLGCKTVTVPEPPTQPTIPELGRAPIGNDELISGGAGVVSVSGWALDPDTAASIKVHVYVDSSGVAYTADDSRADIGAAYPGYGSAHGFAEKLTASAGQHKVCVYAINTGPGGHTLLGCKVVTVTTPQAPLADSGRAPIGNVEAISRANGGVIVSGWALDPDTTASIPVHVYVDSTGVAYTANKERADIGAAYPRYGSAHGFAETVAATAGQHKVCVYAINTGAGGHTLLACKVITV